MLSNVLSARECREELDGQLDELVNFVNFATLQRTAAHEVEKGIFRRILQVGRKTFELFLKLSGDGDQGDLTTLPNGETVKRLKDLHTRMYQSIFGEFKLERAVYGTREKQRIQWVPLDEQLLLPDCKFSYLLQDWSQDLASDGPFNRVNDVLGKILNISQSVNSLERTNRTMAEQVEDFWEQKPPPTAEEEGELMVFQADGKGVVMRPQAGTMDAVKPIPQLHKSSKEPEKNGKKKMALVGASYTVDRYIRTPDQILDALFRLSEKSEHHASRPKPVAKHLRASLLRNEEGKMVPSYDEIFRWQAHELVLRNPGGIKPVIFVMDGQDSLWQAVPKYMPGTPIVPILDIIHATSYVWEAAHLFYPKGSSEAFSFAKVRIQRILHGKVESVIHGLRWKGTYDGLSKKEIEKLETICGYFENNTQRMQYHEYLAAGYPIASGVIEGACRNIIVDRMEQSGMRWVMDGAHAMLGLRCIKLSGLWDEFTEFRVNRECERLYPGHAANDEYVAKIA